VKSKILAVFGSLRFWLTLLGAAVYYLASVGIISQEISDAVIGFLVTSVGIRTLDKFRK